MTDQLISYLRTALDGPEDGFVTFQHLSDEETAMIESFDPSGLTVRPWIESQKHLDGESASLFGRRSLYLRGLLTIGRDARTGEPTLDVTDELKFVADARRLGAAYIVAIATHRDERTARNNVLQSEAGSFEEDIDTDGFHHFSACTYRVALHRLAEWAVPTSGDPPGDLRTQVPANRWPRWVSKELGGDARTAEITIFLPDENDSYTGEVLLVAHNDDTAVLAVSEGKKLRVASTSSSRLEYELVERVSKLLGVQI